MTHVLVKFKKDWADEFDVYGMAVYVKEDWENYYNELENTDEETSVWFGTNEGWEDEACSDYCRSYEVVEIDESMYNFFIKNLSNYDGATHFGYFPNPLEMLD